MLRFSDITFSPISRPFSYNGVVFVTKEDGGTEVLFRRHDFGGAGLETSSRLFFRFAFNSELIIRSLCKLSIDINEMSIIEKT